MWRFFSVYGHRNFIIIAITDSIPDNARVFQGHFDKIHVMQMEGNGSLFLGILPVPLLKKREISVEHWKEGEDS